MLRASACLLLLSLSSCHGFFGDRTRDEDRELNSFAQSRERAATYYDGGHYDRAVLQYQKALEIRPDHVSTRLGYAYSLMRQDKPSSLLEAEKEFVKMGRLHKKEQEIKRIYGRGMTYRNLAKHYHRRTIIRQNEGNNAGATEDAAAARAYARDGIEHLQQVVDLSGDVSSLKPDAYIGMAHCAVVLGEQQGYEDAVRYIQQFADITERARRFWQQRRERVLTIEPPDEEKRAIPPEQEARLYEQKLAGTIREEVAARQALTDTYVRYGRFEEAIAECTKILELDPTTDEMLWIRGRCLGAQGRYAAALNDLKDYRRRQDLTALTERLVRLNQTIEFYEGKLREQAGG